MIHRPYRDLAHHVAKIVKYAQWGADDLYARGRTRRRVGVDRAPGLAFRPRLHCLLRLARRRCRIRRAALSAFAAFLKYAFLFARSQSPEGMKLTILMYHKVDELPTGVRHPGNFVQPGASSSEQMDALLAWGYRTIGFDAMARLLETVHDRLSPTNR